MSGMNCPKQNLPANNLKNKVFKTYPQNRDTLNIKIFLYLNSSYIQTITLLEHSFKRKPIFQKIK